jgi:glycogenin glucosyltransferase
MPYRAPFSSQGLASIQSSPATFGYGDLVDRWFAVYDKHYRPQEPTMHETMQETRYESAWNAPQVEAAAPQVLSLEELRRMAVEGTSSAPPPQETQNAPSERFTEPAPHLEPPPTTTQGNVPEGQYRSLPLEGRFDLMPLPPPAPAREAADAGNDAQLTVVHIVAPSQSNSGEHAYIPHPPALDSVALLQSPQARNLDGADYWQAFPQPQPQPPSFETPQERPRSPPLVTWNPAVEPPPSNPPPQTAFRPSTHFENAWDAPKNKGSGAETFFVAPVQTKIPEHLIREGHYSNVVHAAPAFVPPAPAHPAARPREDVRGEPTVVTTPNIVKQQPPAFMELPAPTPQYVDPYRPDKAKVGAVFPWENKPRHVPGRIFPRAASPPPPSSAVYIASTASTPSSPPPVPAPTRPPLVTQGSSGSRSFTNAWDHVPSIQRYAQKLQKPGSVPQPAAAATTAQTSSPKGKRSRRSSSSTYKSWEDAEGSSSHEADVEDEGNDSSDENGSTQSKRQSRRVSRASPLIRDEKTGKAYRSQGVQTIIPVTNEKAVQVSYFEASTDSQGLVNNFASKPPPPPPPGPRRGFPMLPFNHKALLASQELPASPSIDDYPGPQPSNASKIAQAANRSGDQNGVPPGRNIQKPASRSIYQRSSSDTISSSQGPLSPPESQSIPLPMTSVMSPTAQFQTEPMSPTKPAPRIWDPARGVDVFKRESQEVLARFLRMGSWEGPAQS